DQQHGLAHKGSGYGRATFTFWPVSSAPAALSTSITAVTMPALLTTKPMVFTTPAAEASPAFTLTFVPGWNLSREPTCTLTVTLSLAVSTTVATTAPRPSRSPMRAG